MDDPLNPSHITKQLAKAFCTLQAFQWNTAEGFRLASGVVSPFYVDCRLVLAHPHSRHLVALSAFHRLQNVDIQSLGGLEIGAIPLATAISDFAYQAIPSRTWRTFVVRKQPKDHGLGKLIEGAWEPGDHALIVDDVLTSGGSLLRAVRAARDADLVVTHALVIVDRQEQQGRENVAEEGVTVISLLNLEDLKKAQKELALPSVE